MSEDEIYNIANSIRYYNLYIIFNNKLYKNSITSKYEYFCDIKLNKDKLEKQSNYK